jgi:hypothetical protein
VADDESTPAAADAEPLVEEPAAAEVAHAEPAAAVDLDAESAAPTDDFTPEEHPAEAPLDEVAVGEPVADAPHEEPMDEVVAEEAVVAEPTADDEVVDEPLAAEVSGVDEQPAPSPDEVVSENAALDEPVAEDPATTGADEEPVDEVVAVEAVIAEPAAEVEGTEVVDEVVDRVPSAADTPSREVASEDEGTGSPADEVVADSPADEPADAEPAAGARDDVTIEEPAVEETPGAASVVETPAAGEAGRSYTGTSSSYGSSYGADRPDPAGSGVGWAEQFGTAEASNGWAARYGSADPEPVAEVEPVADDEPLEVEVDLFGDTVADPADDPGRGTAYDSGWAEPTAVESLATDEAGDTDRIAPRASGVDLFAPTPPADAPRAYGNGDRGPNDSGADREPGYAERADRR